MSQIASALWSPYITLSLRICLVVGVGATRTAGLWARCPSHTHNQSILITEVLVLWLSLQMHSFLVKSMTSRFQGVTTPRFSNSLCHWPDIPYPSLFKHLTQKVLDGRHICKHIVILSTKWRTIPTEIVKNWSFVLASNQSVVTFPEDVDK